MMIAVLNRRLPFVAAQRGVGLIEVLIALVIFALGVVGMAGLQLRTVSVTMDSTQRSYVVAKTQDIADRIRSNGIDPVRYMQTQAYNAAGEYCDTIPTICADTASSDVAQCTNVQMSAFDLYDAFCVGEGSLEDQVIDWRVLIGCESLVAGVMTPSTTCDQLGARMTIDISWFGRSVAQDESGVADDDQGRESLSLRFVP